MGRPYACPAAIASRHAGLSQCPCGQEARQWACTKLCNVLREPLSGSGPEAALAAKAAGALHSLAADCHPQLAHTVYAALQEASASCRCPPQLPVLF